MRRTVFTQTAVPLLIDRRDNEFRQRRPTVYQVPVDDGFRQLIMVALWNRAGTIIFLPCGSFYLLSFLFPSLISAVADWMSAILPHMVWP